MKDEKLSIVFSYDYYLFNEKGKVYVDGKEVSRENYDLLKGSTVVSLHNSYLKTLSEGNHTLTLKMDGKEASAHFTITNDPNSGMNKSNESNPPTSDNIIFYVVMLGISIIGFIGVGLYLKKKKIN